MDFPFKVDEAREEMRQAKEEVWSGLSKMGDVVSINSSVHWICAKVYRILIFLN